MRVFVVLLTASFLLAACATAPDTARIERMNSYIGQSERQVISDFGVPDKVYEVDRGMKMITYTTRRQSFPEGPGFDTCIGGRGGHFGYSNCFGGYPSRIRYEYCDLNFRLSRGKVEGWTQNGSACPRIR